MGGRLEARGKPSGGAGRGRFADLVLTVMEKKQTDLTVTNEPSPLPAPTVLFLANSFLHLQSRQLSQKRLLTSLLHSHQHPTLFPTPCC